MLSCNRTAYFFCLSVCVCVDADWDYGLASRPRFDCLCATRGLWLGWCGAWGSTVQVGSWRCEHEIFHLRRVICSALCFCFSFALFSNNPVNSIRSQVFALCQHFCNKNELKNTCQSKYIYDYIWTLPVQKGFLCMLEIILRNNFIPQKEFDFIMDACM